MQHARIGFGLCVLAIVCLAALPAGAVELHGAAILGYSDREGGAYLMPGEFHGEWENPSAVLSASHRATDAISTSVRINMAAGSFTIAEGWVAFEGLPYNGQVTVGRFQKPLGEPLLTIGLSYPALLFHAASVDGGKLEMERGLWNWEIGLVNQNPLSALGTLISGSPAFARPIAAGNVMPENSKELYLNLGRRFGGEWGSLDLSVTQTTSRMLEQDVNLIAAMGVFDISRNERTRNIWDVAADYTYGDYRVFGEYVSAAEGALSIYAYNISLARRWRDYEFVAGWDFLRTNASTRPPSIPASWNRSRMTLGANWQMADNIKVMGQYEFNQEVLSRHNYGGKQALPNDGFALQAVFSF